MPQALRLSLRLASKIVPSALYDSAPVGYMTLNAEGTILEANLTTAAMLGIDRRKLLKANIFKFVSPNFCSDLNLQLTAAFSGKGNQGCEVEMWRRQGESIAVRLEPMRAGYHKDRGYQIALIDITDRKTAENALRWTNRTLEARVQKQIAQNRLQAEAISHVGEGVVLTVGSEWPESKIVFVNQAMRRITGYTAEELVASQGACFWAARQITTF